MSSNRLSSPEELSAFLRDPDWELQNNFQKQLQRGDRNRLGSTGAMVVASFPSSFGSGFGSGDDGDGCGSSGSEGGVFAMGRALETPPPRKEMSEKFGEMILRQVGHKIGYKGRGQAFIPIANYPSDVRPTFGRRRRQTEAAAVAELIRKGGGRNSNYRTHNHNTSHSTTTSDGSGGGRSGGTSSLPSSLPSSSTWV